MNNTRPPVLGFAAASGTGKTTLLEKLIPLLKNTSLRIGLIKHSHHNFEIDKPGKDSYRLRKAGASPILLVSNHRQAIMTEFDTITEPLLEDQLKFFDDKELELILVEGFKAEAFPKIELYRSCLNNMLIFPNDPNIIAIASDEKINITADNTNLSIHQINQLIPPPILDINNPNSIVNFILDQFLDIRKNNQKI